MLTLSLGIVSFPVFCLPHLQPVQLTGDQLSLGRQRGHQPHLMVPKCLHHSGDMASKDCAATGDALCLPRVTMSGLGGREAQEHWPLVPGILGCQSS